MIIDGYRVLDVVKSPCGETANIEPDAGYPCYRCEGCGAVIGSVAMPDACRTLMNRNKEGDK
jgi:hypothetical protein